MTTAVTDEQVRELAATIEAAHQRRMVSLRGDGAIAILCPVSSDPLAGTAILEVPPERATRS